MSCNYIGIKETIKLVNSCTDFWAYIKTNIKGLYYNNNNNHCIMCQLLQLIRYP